eukprot:TRINITY_DN95745_c0_g1_i1.p1 TRINITY_DN95745_c0_g1~~TRINITY_DN95745_c0_g1_i1.p1  ORF type:complete len:188 (+),score=16.53 TRINITY_DN95745_c0_g1_i1:43-606(+)
MDASARYAEVQDRQPTYVLTASLPRFTPGEVRAHITDPHKIKAAHPLILDITVKRNDVDERGNQIIVADVVDLLKVCCCFFHLTYTAYWAIPPPASSGAEHIIACTDVSGTRVVHKYELESIGGGTGTKIVDRVWIEASCLLRRYVVSTARAAHVESLQKLPGHMVGNEDVAVVDVEEGSDRRLFQT